MKDRELLFAVKIFVVVISLAIAGCTAASPFSTPPAEPIFSDSASIISPIPPTYTSLPAILTPSVEPTLTPTPTTMPTFTPTVQPTATATEMPFTVPTPQGNDTNEQVLWLLETNNGCQLPCWWGITPGQTKWEAAEQFFNTFVPDINSVVSRQMVNYSPVIPLPSQVFETGNAYASNTYPIYTVRDDIVDEILTEVSIGDTPPGYLTPYVLSTFLTTYGQPSEIWLFTYSSPYEEGDLPFVVVLSYPDKGIITLYSDNGVRQGNLVQGCPQEDPVSILKLWSPDLKLTFEQIKSGSSAIGADREYLSLEEATEMDATIFYETFKNPDNTTCLETPADLWR